MGAFADQNSPEPTPTEEKFQPACARAANSYLGRGWSVVPLRHRDKKPLVDWEKLQTARPSKREVEAWFDRWPDANIGIVAGEISNLVVVDIDPGHGGWQSLARLENRYGALPVSVEAKTGGGRHLYFAHPGALIRNRTGFFDGIDLRGDGGYVVAPPSVHPNGTAYDWVAGLSPDEVSLAPLSRWLRMRVGEKHLRHSLPDWRRLVREGVPVSRRNSSIASLAGHLFWHGIDPQVALELLLAWNRMRCRPPLDDVEVAQVVDSIPRLHLSDEVKSIA